MLRGQRVVLQPIEPEHLPNYVRWLADPDVLAYFGPYRPMNLAQEQAWYARQNEDPSTVIFACDYEGRHIGGGGFGNLNHANHSAEVGLFIGEKSLWDQGLGKDMLATLVAYGFDYLNLHRIYRCASDKLRRRAAAASAGMSRCGSASISKPTMNLRTVAERSSGG
jgi:RimJ/RimL family protein N-acetyltransferase